MADCRTANGPLAYRDYGEEGTNTPLVLLHAFPLNSRMWTAQAEALADERRVICPDYPGFGRSPQAPPNRTFTTTPKACAASSNVWTSTA